MGQGARNPEGVWDWVVGNDLETLGRHLTNREVYNYIEACNVVKSHKLAEIIGRSFLSVEFMGDLEESVCDTSRVELPNFLKREKCFKSGRN